MDNLQIIQSFVLDKAEHESLAVRERMYRALASIGATKEESRKLLSMANALRKVERASAQLRFDFRHNI